MSRTTTKVRAFSEDNDLLKVLALKISSRRERITTTAEVLHEIIREVTESGNRDIDEVSDKLSNRFTNSG